MPYAKEKQNSMCRWLTSCRVLRYAASFWWTLSSKFGGRKFYRPYGFNSEPGQHSSGISEHQSKRRKLHSRNRQQKHQWHRVFTARNSCRESEVYCHRKSARIPPKAGKTQRHSETKRKNQTVRYSLYLGQAGTAMYQTGHRANLRSEIQRQQLRLSPEPFRGTRRAENLHHASTHEPALCDWVWYKRIFRQRKSQQANAANMGNGNTRQAVDFYYQADSESTD